MSFIQKIFYGPTGTGKTWRATREAVRAVLGDKEYESVRSKPDGDTELVRLYRDFVKDGRIVEVTFHPGYSYEDFIEGYRPVVNPGQLAPTVVDGLFKQLCERARGEPDLYIGDFLLDGSNNVAGEVVDKDGGGWLVRSRPGRSDEISPETSRYVSRIILKRIMATGLPATIFSIPGNKLLDLSEYGLHPTDRDVPPPSADDAERESMRVGNNIRRIVGGRVQMSSTELGNSAHYGWVYRRMLELKKKIQPVACALVIDEINRADLSRVFGELLTLLERDKREGMPEEKRAWLPYSKSSLCVPGNLSIIGTLNTVDRSLTAMDYALRRRFEFEFSDVEPGLCPENYGGINVSGILRTLNQRLCVLLDSDHRIGHGSLMEKALDEIAERHGWVGKEGAAERAIAHVWRSYIIPIVLEYFRNDPSKARAVAGLAEKNGVVHDLFNPVRADTRSCVQAQWWNPLSEQWKREDFRAFLQAFAA